jgi:hypothetical protein
MDRREDAICERPRSPDGPLAPASPPEAPHRSSLRTRVVGLAGRALLVLVVLVLGLVHGSRTALGGAPAPSPAALPDVAAPPAREPDWRRGHFYRPPGSTARRPGVALRPLSWRPAQASDERVARACSGREGRSDSC